ncbi:MAG: penicillin-binding protein [Actinomycetia bacterium]|nr:penicillin-binding protein [Actinomycetes bacterium]
MATPSLSRWARIKAKLPRRKRRSIFWRLRRVFFLLFLLGIATLSGVAWALAQIELPAGYADQENELVQNSFVCSAEVVERCGPENAIASLSAGEDRLNVTYEQLPQVLIDAVVSAEDQDFFVHAGVDPVGITRAAWNDIRGVGVTQGGSTITQQYVKNAFLTKDRTVKRKIQEAVLAIKLERELTKEEILLRYLNRIYFGRGAYGVQAASQAYFNKDIEELDLADSAYLAGLIRAPEAAEATRDPAVAHQRRASVIARMLEDELITQAEADAANARPWDVCLGAQRSNQFCSVVQKLSREGLGEVVGAHYGTEYFVDWVRRFVSDDLGLGGAIYTKGLRIYTTLDHDMQRAAFETITDVLDPDNPDDPAASIVSIDDQGRVRAMVGGFDFDESEVNLALGVDGGGSGRQPGSSFKPFVLAEAISQGFSARSFFLAPRVIVLEGANAGRDWTVRGGSSASGSMDLLQATRVSSNVVYAQLMLEVGPANVVNTAHRLGISADLPEVNSLVLGAGEVSVLDMATAYNTLAREGTRIDPTFITRIEEADGTVVWEWDPDPREVIDSGVARQVTYALSRVVDGGTGRKAAYGQPASGKTGTTQDNRDAWFVGYTCKLTTAVWMGYVGEPGEPPRFMDDFRGIQVQGGTFPAEMWGAYMSRATQGLDSCEIPQPSGYPGRQLNPGLRDGTTTTTGSTTTSTTGTTLLGATTTSSSSSSTTAPSPGTTMPATTTTTSPPASTTTSEATTTTTSAG